MNYYIGKKKKSNQEKGKFSSGKNRPNNIEKLFLYEWRGKSNN